MARIEQKKYRISPAPMDTMTGRELKKTEIDKAIYERAVGMRKPNVFSHKNNTKSKELPY